MIGWTAVAAQLGKPEPPLVMSGVDQLDRTVDGVQSGALWVVTGPPRHGRTMFSMQVASRAVAADVPARILAGADPVTYYGSLVSAAVRDMPLRDVVLGRQRSDPIGQLPVEFATRRHMSLAQALEAAPDRCLLVLDDADLWATSALDACSEVRAWLSSYRAAVVTVPRESVGPDRPSWQQWVRLADVILEVEMGTDQTAGEATFTVMSNRRGPVTVVAAQAEYYRVLFADLT